MSKENINNVLDNAPKKPVPAFDEYTVSDIRGPKKAKRIVKHKVNPKSLGDIRDINGMYNAADVLFKPNPEENQRPIDKLEKLHNKYLDKEQEKHDKEMGVPEKQAERKKKAEEFEANATKEASERQKDLETRTIYPEDGKGPTQVFNSVGEMEAYKSKLSDAADEGKRKIAEAQGYNADVLHHTVEGAAKKEPTEKVLSTAEWQVAHPIQKGGKKAGEDKKYDPGTKSKDWDAYRRNRVQDSVNEHHETGGNTEKGTGHVTGIGPKSDFKKDNSAALAAGFDLGQARNAYNTRKEKIEKIRANKQAVIDQAKDVGFEDLEDGTHYFVQKLFKKDGKMTPTLRNNIYKAVTAANPTPVQQVVIDTMNDLLDSKKEAELTPRDIVFLDACSEAPKIGDLGAELRKKEDAYYKAVQGPRYRDAESMPLRSGGYAITVPSISGPSHRFILKEPEIDQQTGKEIMNLYLAGNKQGSYENIEATKKEMSGASDSDKFDAMYHANTKRRLQSYDITDMTANIKAKHPDMSDEDARRAAIEEAVMSSKNYAEAELESDNTLSERRPFATRRTNNKALADLITNRMVGGNINDEKFLEEMKDHLVKHGSLTPEEFSKQRLANMIGGVLKVIGENTPSDPMFAIDTTGKIGYADDIPKDQRLLTPDDYAKALSTPTVSKTLSPQNVRGFTARGGLQGTENLKTGKTSVKQTGIGNVAWDDVKRQTADIEEKVKGLQYYPLEDEDLAPMRAIDPNASDEELETMWLDAMAQKVAELEASTKKNTEVTPERLAAAKEKVYGWAGRDTEKKQKAREKKEAKMTRLNSNILDAFTR